MRHHYVDLNGTVHSWDVEVEPSEEELARESAVAKLQALGLTEAEALALVGGV